MFELYAMDGGGRVCLVFPPKPDPPPMDGAGKDIDTKYYILTIGRLEKFSWKEDACLVGLFDHVNFRAGLPNLICYAIKHTSLSCL